MLTKRSSESLSKLGASLRVHRLIAQAHATLARVTGDQLVAKRLGAVFIAEMKAAIEGLETVATSRSMADAISKMATGRQNDAIREGMAWHREFISLASRAVYHGLEVPPE